MIHLQLHREPGPDVKDGNRKLPTARQRHAAGEGSQSPSISRDTPHRRCRDDNAITRRTGTQYEIPELDGPHRLRLQESRTTGDRGRPRGPEHHTHRASQIPGSSMGRDHHRRPRGEGQDVADLLYAKPELVNLAAHHAEYYFQEGIMEFSLNALTDEQKRNVERNTGRRLRGAEEE